MKGRRRHTLLATICAGGLALSSGCHLLGRRNPPPPLFSPVLQPGASLTQVIEAVHNNSGRIQSFSSHEVALSGPGIPVTLRGASIVFERPRRLRIQAGTALTSELDVGSNDELFWFWVRRSEMPAVFFCRHDQYATCAAAQKIPVDPNWLIEAFGIVEFSPNERHQGPFVRPDGKLELLTERQTPCGPATKKTVIDASTALVHEQHLYDYGGRLVASITVREHRLDPLTNLVMPRIIDLQYPQAEFSMLVNLGNAEINRPTHSQTLWSMPLIPGWPQVNLADPNWPQVFGRQPIPVRSGPPPASAASADYRRDFNRLR